MPPKRTPSVQRRNKGEDEAPADSETPDKPVSPKPTRQTTIDKHLKSTETQMEETLRGFSEKLNKLASQEYIEEKFNTMVTEAILCAKLKDLEKELKSNVKKEFDKVYTQIGALQNRVVEAENSMETMHNKISDMETSIDSMQTKCENASKQNEAMKLQLLDRETKIRFQADQLNNLEQYTRRNSIRIYGIQDTKKEETPMDSAKQVINMINNKLNISLTVQHVDIAHRMGKYTKDANRPIICKFVSRVTKQEVIKARRRLKNTAIVIREDLTLQNAKLLERTSSEEIVKSAWSDEGKILALLKNNKTILVDSKTDFSVIPH